MLNPLDPQNGYQITAEDYKDLEHRSAKLRDAITHDPPDLMRLTIQLDPLPLMTENGYSQEVLDAIELIRSRLHIQLLSADGYIDGSYSQFFNNFHPRDFGPMPHTGSEEISDRTLGISYPGISIGFPTDPKRLPEIEKVEARFVLVGAPQTTTKEDKTPPQNIDEKEETSAEILRRMLENNE